MNAGHVKAKSTLPLVVVVVMALLVNFALELIHYNHFDGSMSGAVFRFAVHGQHLLHLALYVSFFISHENIMEEYIMLAVTALLAVYEVVAFVQSLYFKNSDHDKDKSEHGKKNEDEGVDTESAQEATVVQQSHSGVFFPAQKTRVDLTEYLECEHRLLPKISCVSQGGCAHRRECRVWRAGSRPTPWAAQSLFPE